jgi:hypothetical protein
VSTLEESARLGHYRAEGRLREAAVPAPSSQPRPEEHSEAMAVSHEGRPTIQQQQERPVLP